MTKPFNLQDYGITVAQIHRNLPPSVLYEYAIIPCNYQQPVLCRRSVVPSRRPSSSKGAICYDFVNSFSAPQRSALLAKKW